MVNFLLKIINIIILKDIYVKSNDEYKVIKECFAAIGDEYSSFLDKAPVNIKIKFQNLFINSHPRDYSKNEQDEMWQGVLDVYLRDSKENFTKKYSAAKNNIVISLEIKDKDRDYLIRQLKYLNKVYLSEIEEWDTNKIHEMFSEERAGILDETSKKENFDGIVSKAIDHIKQTQKTNKYKLYCIRTVFILTIVILAIIAIPCIKEVGLGYITMFKEWLMSSFP